MENKETIKPGKERKENSEILKIMNSVSYKKNSQSCQFIFSKLWSNFRTWHFCLSLSNGEESDSSLKNSLELRRSLQTWTFDNSKRKMEKYTAPWFSPAKHNWYSSNAISENFVWGISLACSGFNLYEKSANILFYFTVGHPSLLEA